MLVEIETDIDMKDTVTSVDFWYEVVMHLNIKDTRYVWLSFKQLKFLPFFHRFIELCSLISWEIIDLQSLLFCWRDKLNKEKIDNSIKLKMHGDNIYDLKMKHYKMLEQLWQRSNEAHLEHNSITDRGISTS